MLNRCPSCKASVLDDDAETCPFCGSPMDPAKAKGYAPAAQAPAAAPAKPAAKPAAPAAKPAAAKPAAAAAKAAPAPADDDPFATDAAATAGAVPLSRKATPQRPHKIVCPMCDTAGYAPVAASGKEVRCANPKCLVPVFTAPDFAAPKPAEPEPQPSGMGATIVTFAVIGVILVGVAVWWFVLREPAAGPSITPVAVTPVTPTQPTEPTEPEPTEPAEQPPAPPSPAETLAAVLNRWPRVADDITQPQRQSLLRRYAAESYAIAGRVDAAREQITKLGAARSGDPFYQITPLVELAWAHLAKGDEAAARAVFEESAPLTGGIPQQGFDPARVAIDWSAAASRFGQDQTARDLARAPRDDAAGERLLTSLRSASLFNQGDLDAEHPLRPALPPNEPKSTATTLDLLAHGARDAARSWAAGSPEPATRADGLAAWAEAVAADTSRPAEERVAAIDEAISASEPAEKAFVLARASVRAAGRGDTQAAEGLLSRAVEAASGLPAPEPFAAADMAEFARRELPNQAAVRLRASAFAEAAHAAALLGKTEQAGTLLSQALEHLRAAAPTPDATAERQQEFDRLGIAGAQSELKSLLNLPSDDRARSAANEYRRKLQDVQAASASRFDLQAELLARAIGWKLGPQVLAEAKRRNAEQDANARERYLAGAAGGRLLAAAEAAGDAATATELRAAGVTNRDVPAPEALALTITPMLADGKAEAAGREFDSNVWRRVGRSEKLALAIRSACRLAKRRSAADAYTFATAMRDDALREETLRYLSACIARAGKGAEAEALLPKLKILPSEQAAALRGLTEGLVAAGAAAAGTGAPGTGAAAAAAPAGT